MGPRHRPVEIYDFVRAMPGSPGTPWWVLVAWAFGTLIGNTVPAILGTTCVLVLATLIALVFLIWWYYKQVQSQKRDLCIELTERKPPQMLGLILPVSTLSPIGKATETEKEALLALPAKVEVSSTLTPNEDQLLQRSNLMPSMAALEYHYGEPVESQDKASSRLRDCWLITTEDVPYPEREEQREHGSGPVAKLLVRWFFTRHPEAEGNVHFYQDEYKGLQLVVHSRDYTRMAHLVSDIFRKAPCKPEDLIADITPGTKPMTIAIALACLEPKRTMEYMTSQRDPFTGEPLSGGEFRPVLIDIDAYVSQSDEE